MQKLWFFFINYLFTIVFELHIFNEASKRENDHYKRFTIVPSMAILRASVLNYWMLQMPCRWEGIKILIVSAYRDQWILHFSCISHLTYLLRLYWYHIYLHTSQIRGRNMAKRWVPSYTCNVTCPGNWEIWQGGQDIFKETITGQVCWHLGLVELTCLRSTFKYE